MGTWETVDRKAVIGVWLELQVLPRLKMTRLVMRSPFGPSRILWEALEPPDYEAATKQMGYAYRVACAALENLQYIQNEEIALEQAARENET